MMHFCSSMTLESYEKIHACISVFSIQLYNCILPDIVSWNFKVIISTKLYAAMDKILTETSL